jgi:enoyl-CoA hydratase/carnithine racemase
VLEGAGDRSFCAGEDLKQTLAPKTGSGEELRYSFELLQELTRLTSSSKVLIIAAVQGYAIGGGAELALAADFVIGGSKTVFRFPEVPIGHAVTRGFSLRLVQMVGLLRAKELFLCGRFVAAEESLKIGLLSEIVENPKERALELAKELAKLPRISASTSKSSLERAVFPNLEAVLADEVNVANYCFAQSDADKAFSDFAARKSKTNRSHGGILNG